MPGPGARIAAAPGSGGDLGAGDAPRFGGDRLGGVRRSGKSGVAPRPRVVRGSGGSGDRGGPGSGGARGRGLPRVPALPMPSCPPQKVCGSCSGPPRNGSIVSRFCESRGDTENDGRCCRERGPPPGRLLGLDLSNCSLHSVPPELAEATAAIVLDLTENPLTSLPNDSFLGFTHLQLLLAVSRKLCVCPRWPRPRPVPL
ncbi:all-trans retinoic acid-induced differentiation factor isoform X3 [Corapipo altera]|uniref:all-trans retinoic acid-induced differentiation factor isoform X3 n=1 Tax=Corapipo altera TaxID=415028 RepID=UPI000FD6616D|nr:all-trans retinoic acid-induced differentiation factor isoform X3 [Corapipo altera]